ncbi:hypothetical protein V5O48_012113 [Marasmius crinis-equi]|uniref:Uncharacterized protein n=1 Tax=Marasmius crinis-equi TaxID=585013 RepID=A0ABR3F3P1_9AGAR
MDILLPVGLVTQHPNVVSKLEDIIHRERSSECLGVVPLNNLENLADKTIRFDLGGRIDPRKLTECGFDNPEKVAFVWLSIDEMLRDGNAGLESLTTTVMDLQKWAVMVVGETDESQKEKAEDLAIRLFMRSRVRCMFIQTVEEAVEELYRWSISLNRFFALYPEHNLEVDYVARVSMLLLREPLKVPLARQVAQAWLDDSRARAMANELLVGSTRMMGPEPREDR